MVCPYRPVDLLPHDLPMVLLDEVLSWDQTGAVAALTIGVDTPFLQAGQGVPAHVGMEWMAQLCGIFAGLQAKEANEPVRLGFLLGTRRYRANQAYFPLGMRVEVSGRQVFREGGMAVFDCRIHSPDGSELAASQLTLYQPEDASSILANQTMG